MALFKCKMCGGALEIQNNETVATCEYCGTQQTLPKLDDDRRANLYDRANHFRRNNEFDKAMGIYEQILNEDNTDAEAYWSLVLCRYGIEYVEDPSSHKRIPTVNRAQFTSVFDDDNYKSALQYADGYQRSIYEEEAKVINEIQKGILAISSQEEPFDVFICYKETDNNGRRTPDSVLANDLYHQLTQEGFKVFFARITLEDKLGSAYEPYIFAALNSAKVMVVLGTKPEFFKAVWVRNEWSRYLALIKQGQKKMLIPAYKDMDPYDLPEEFSHLQAQDMSKLGFMQDLIRGIKKIIGSDEQKSSIRNVAVETGVNTDALLKRAFIFLEDQNWDNADNYLEKVLDAEPENAIAYLGKMMLELRVARQDELAELATPFDDNGYFEKAIRYADATLKNTLEGYIVTISERNEHNRLEAAYQEATSMMESADDESDYIVAAEKKVFALENAISKFEQISEYKDSADKISKIKLDIEELNNKIEIKRKRNKKIAIILSSTAVCAFVFLMVLFNSIIPAVKYNSADKCVESGEYLKAVEIYEELIDYKDSAAKIIPTRYLLASVQLENNEYKNAYNNFSLINNYEDSEAKRQASGYGYAQGLIAEKKYKKAVKVFDSIGEYQNSVELSKSAKYEYVQIRKDNKNTTTFEYLKELKSAGYKDSASIYKELYAWKATIIANDDENDETTDMSSISKYSNWYFHVSLSGGEPGATTEIKRKGQYPDGAISGPKTWSDGSAWGDGYSGTCWYYYETPLYGKQGTFKLTIYDDNGNIIGEKSIKITG